MKRNTNFISGQWFGLLILGVITTFGAAGAQEKAPGNQDSKQAQQASQAPKTEDKKTSPKKPAFTLLVKTEPILNVSLKAEKAKLAEIGEALSKKLKIPVFVGAGVEKEVISTEFSELTLEPAMQLLAPAVYIDYEIRTESGAPPRPLGVFFYAADQPEPSTTAVVTGSTQSMLIEGDTEEGVEPDTEEERKKREEAPLKVSYDNSLMSVKAKKQPLALVLLKIGEELGIPVDIQADTSEIVDVELNKMPVEDVVRQLSPNIQLFLRADLAHAERRALRLVLPQATRAAQPNL
ncbi:MAG TPA: hypothetical protein VLA93_05140 [Pyrinomonadaceae bacterium]|nr:hypothetical protein [Pyrinomonadaceae bacterium]